MTPTPNGATIKHVTEVSGIDSLGRPIQQIRVEYSVGSHGPFYELFPKSEFTAPHVTQTLDKFAQQLRQIAP